LVKGGNTFLYWAILNLIKGGNKFPYFVDFPFDCLQEILVPN
jgi:hypothetical protein